ncbi:MAG: glycosyltransferase family 1 protein, partial [Planctomycetota bacterium]
LPEVAGPDVPSFAPDDPAACAAAIRAALTQPSERLAEHAARATRYSWDESARLLCAAWRATPHRE